MPPPRLKKKGRTISAFQLILEFLVDQRQMYKE